MGEIADMMLDGTLCQCCGEFLDGDSPGYPRYCSSCRPNKKRKKKTSVKAVLINPFKKTISLIDLKKDGDEIDLKHCYELMDCTFVTFVYAKGNKLLVVDEEGLMKENNMPFKIDKVGQEYFVGKALLVQENQQIPTDLNEQELPFLKNKISFPQVIEE